MLAAPARLATCLRALLTKHVGHLTNRDAFSIDHNWSALFMLHLDLVTSPGFPLDVLVVDRLEKARENELSYS